jgi:putative hydrolase of the HAD superfamily
MALKAVIFDLDDTLIDWSDHQIDWRELRSRQIQPVYAHMVQLGYMLPSLEEVASLYNDINYNAWMSISGPEWYAPRQIDALRETLRRMDILSTDEELAMLQQHFAWGPLPGIRAFPDAVDVLKSIRAAGLSTGLLTNASSPMWMRDRELEALGLLEYLEVRATAGDVGRLKPHPGSFQYVLAKLEVSACDAIFVGDRLYDDIAGAQQVGMRAVWVRRANAEHANDVIPDAEIETLTGLLSTLDHWHPGWR